MRQWMEGNSLSAFIVPTIDPHSGEYVPEHWQSRRWLSGFTGSAGTLVVTSKDAGLWTDSRYFLQAEDQLKGTGIKLFKLNMPGTPSQENWLGEVLHKGEVVGVDGWIFTAEMYDSLKEQLEDYGLVLKSMADPFNTIWEDRPSLPESPVFILQEKYTGKTCIEKVETIRKSLESFKAEHIIVSSLDQIAWTLNMRGNDVNCNPLFVSYLIIDLNDGPTLYINKVKLSDAVEQYLADNHVKVSGYDDLEAGIRKLSHGTILLPKGTSFAIRELAREQNKVITALSPLEEMKAIKNPTEIEGFRNCMIRDGVAMVKFIKWMKEAAKTCKETEYTIDKKLYEFRAQQKHFQGISFETIAGYQEHGAVVHYTATEETALTIRPEGWLLLDSGAQYLDGTTDITRTIVLGTLTEQQRQDYTIILKGVIALTKAKFPEGTCGTQLDVLARQFLWQAGINYGHGTGHGVGHFLCVHEGPHQLRMNYMPAHLKAGMTLTNEPGIYRANQHGIRIENTMLIVNDKETEFGKFYRFETLTLCPIDKEPIITEMLTAEEKQWLNDYHNTVYKKLSPFLNEEEKHWLKEATKEIE